MKAIQNLAGYLNWLKIEHKDKKSVQDTYTLISQEGKYDEYINYNSRVKALGTLVADLNFTQKNVLDLACGTGAFINTVIAKNPQEIVGVDLTQGMLDIARKRFANQTNLKLICSSFITVDLPTNHFDYILLANAARYIPTGKEELFFSNVKKWLKPQGTFIILSDVVSGRVLAPLIFTFLDKEKANTNTAFAWNLEKELKKYFEIYKVVKIGWNFGNRSKHHAFFCKY